MFFTISLCLVALFILWPRLNKFIKIMKIPGPLFPKGLKGNLPEYMEQPRQCGPQMASKYGPLYRWNITTKHRFVF